MGAGVKRVRTVTRLQWGMKSEGRLEHDLEMAPLRGSLNMDRHAG
jgi:hypothetical protein